MVLYYADSYSPMFPAASNHRQNFNLGPYGYAPPTPHQSAAAQYGSSTDPIAACNQFQISEQQPPPPPPTWHSSSVYPVSGPIPASSCARSYDEWPGQPSASPSAPQPVPPPCTASPCYGYKVTLSSNGHPQDFGPQHAGGHHSPDSGLTVSSDGVSSSDSPQHVVTSQHAALTRPPPVRSPFEWMKKPSYQNQVNPGRNDNRNCSCLGQDDDLGKTRTKDKYRVVYSDHQRLELEKEFHYSRYITIRRKSELAQMLGLSERQVKIWFQNRRAKERKQVKKREELKDKEISPHVQLVPPNGLPSKVITLE